MIEASKKNDLLLDNIPELAEFMPDSAKIIHLLEAGLIVAPSIQSMQTPNDVVRYLIDYEMQQLHQSSYYRPNYRDSNYNEQECAVKKEEYYQEMLQLSENGENIVFNVNYRINRLVDDTLLRLLGAKMKSIKKFNTFVWVLPFERLQKAKAIVSEAKKLRTSSALIDDQIARATERAHDELNPVLTWAGDTESVGSSSVAQVADGDEAEERQGASTDLEQA